MRTYPCMMSGHLAIGLLVTTCIKQLFSMRPLDEVKAHADYITSSVDEDGITNALKHFEII